jgi:hypothetical protein
MQTAAGRTATAALAYLLLSAACTPKAVPLHAGAEAQRTQEHVFLYPLREALAATVDVLEARDYAVEPFKDEQHLLTRWKQQGQRSPIVLGRYYVEGLELGPRQSVVRIFYIHKNPNSLFGANPIEQELQNAAAQPSRKQRSRNGAQESSEATWREFVAAGSISRSQAAVEGDRQGGSFLDADASAGESPEEQAQRAAANPDNVALRLAGDPKFSGQYRMPNQDELRGGNERGVRDSLLERALVQRLEQFPSLEFTGGALDVPAPPAPPGAPPYTAAWEQELGGTPFSAKEPCGQPVAGLESVTAPGSALLVGEQLGSREAPATVGNLACQMASGGHPVLLGLGLPRDEQGLVDAYVRSAGTRADQDALLAGASWRRVPRDGRSSRALVVLLERVRRWRADGLKVEPVTYDAPGAQHNAREEAIAQLLLQRREAMPQALMLVLGGNDHVRASAGASWFRRFEPFGLRLAQAGVPVKSVDLAYRRGTRWACSVHVLKDQPDCRVFMSAPSDASFSPEGHAPGLELFAQRSPEGFDGLLHVGTLSASLPAVLPRTQASAAR